MNGTVDGQLRALIEARLARCDELRRRRLRCVSAAGRMAGAVEACTAEACAVMERAVEACVPCEDGAAPRARLPEGLKLPDDMPHPPNLKAANLSFAARVVLAVRDRFGGDAPRVYRSARATRQSYSQIVSDETHGVDKKTALRFCFALRCSAAEAVLLLKSAGYAFSNANRRDCVLQACLEADPPVWDLDEVNLLLREYRVDFQF